MINYCVGVYGSDEEDESLNLKDINDFVQGIQRRQAKAGALTGSKVFFFTNNSTAEAAIYQGNSKSKQLHELLVELKVLQARSGFCFLLLVCATSLEK